MRKIQFVGYFVTAMLLCFSSPVLGADTKNDVNEIGNRKVAHRSIISEEKEVAIGRQYATEVERNAKLVTDPIILEYVNRVAQNVARNSDLKVPLTVKVIKSPEINAFALPGGFLYVNSGLVQAADEEDEIAGVIGHEIAHVACRHWAAQMTKSTLLQFATIPLIFIPMSYPVYLGISEAFMNGVPLAFLKFDRNAEAEADRLGIQYMYKAGYDPQSYVTFFGKIIQEERRQPGSVPKVFADHPPTADRIIKAQEEIKQILPARDQYLVSTSEFDDIKTRMNTMAHVQRAQNKQDDRPTLIKREPKDESKTQTPSGQDSGTTDGDKPPVLRRRDSSGD